MSIRKSWAHLPKEAKRLWEKRGSEGAEKSNEPQKEKVNVLRLKNTITLSTQSLADEYETNKADLFAFLNYKRSQ